MVRMISFVALGDSLTVGFIPETFPINYPYTEFLKEIVDDFLKQVGKDDTVDVTIMNRGVNGELTSDMLLRFRRDVIALRPSCLIVFGGTNDIGWGVPVEEIFANLTRMFHVAMDNAIEPMGCTVPSVLGWDEGVNRLEPEFSSKSIPLNESDSSRVSRVVGLPRGAYPSSSVGLLVQAPFGPESTKNLIAKNNLLTTRETMTQWDAVEEKINSIENRIGKLEERIKELEKEVEKNLKETRNLVYKVSGATVLNNDLWSRNRSIFSTLRTMNKETFIAEVGEILRNEKGLITDYPDFKEWSINNARDRVHNYFLMFNIKKLNFEFCEIVFRGLGRELAKELIAVEDIIKYYGSRDAGRWREL